MEEKPPLTTNDQVGLYMLKHLNMLTANPTFARIGSRISFDMLKSLRKASVFWTFQNLKPKNPKEPKPLKA